MLRYARLEDIMKYFRFRLCIQVVLLITTVSVSPILAEQAIPPKADNTVHGSQTPYVGPGILDVLPKSGGTVKSAFPSGSDASVKVSSPGRTYGTLTAILIAAGGAAALGFLLTR